MNKPYNYQKIYHRASETPGPALTLMAGVHGNETAGILALQRFIKEDMPLLRGSVTMIFGNPRAIEQSARFTEVNLNRCFLPNTEGDSYEAKRAQEIMPYLNDADALLDIHASNIPGSEPFIICEENALPIARKFQMHILSTGWDAIEPGASDGYMFQQGKVGICAECGYAGDGEQYQDLAYDTLRRFLDHYDVLAYEYEEPDESLQRLLHVDQVVMKTREDFVFTRMYPDFATLKKGECFAKDGESEYCVDRERVIVFANPDKEVGGEACILGSWQ